MTGDDINAPLTTETGATRFAGIDRMATADLAALMNDEDATVPLAVRAALPAIVRAIDAIEARMTAGGRLIYVGAGSSGRIGVLDASEIPPTFGTSPDHVLALIAGGPDAIVLPQEGAEDDVDAGIAAIDGVLVSPDDVVVGIASSGRTPYVIAALSRAGESGACTIGLSCNEESELDAVCDIPIEVPVGPEFVAGSTRLKAGTAQKLVLNMLSTITMVRLGKTYGNLMVDLSPTNTKLRARATGIVGDIAGVGRDEADDALRRTAFDVKQAVLVARLGIPPEEASARLIRAGGRLRGALDEHPPKENTP